MSDTLALTLAALLPRMADASLRDPWWVIGSAAAALAGADEAAVHDVDLLLSARDADAFIEANGDARDAGYVPAGSTRFRSRFARFDFAPLPVEVMGALELFREGHWQPVTVRETQLVAIPSGAVRIPSVREQIVLLEAFGRDKDRARAGRLRGFVTGDVHVA